VRITLALLLLCAACEPANGVGAETLDRVLDAITEMAAPAQETVRSGCARRESAASSLPSLDAARAEIARVRSDCDAVFAAFAVVREAQIAARGAAQAARDGRISAEEALQVGLRVRTAYEALQVALATLDDGDRWEFAR
jgi:hypothetical protein